MNTLQMQYLIALADHMSFTRAAGALFISQPTLSRQIELLEQELGFPLVQRGKKQISLTAAGQIMLDTARQMLRLLESGREQGLRISAGSAGFLRIGALDSIGGHVLIPNLIRPYREAWPDVELSLERHSFHTLRDRLELGSLDVTLTAAIDCENMNAVELHPFATFQKVLLMSRHHPLAGRTDLTPIQFKDELFLLPGEEDSPGRREALFATTEPYGFLPSRTRTTPNLESAFFSVAAGLGVMIVDMSTKYVQDPQCTYLPLPGDVPPCAKLMAVRKRANQNPAALEFMSYLSSLENRELNRSL